MDAHHPTIDWDASTAARLTPELRDGLGTMWRRRALSEHRSTGIFNQFVLDLLGAGAPAEVLSLACRAALDEVRHAELFARVTSLYAGAPPEMPAQIPEMPDERDVPIRHQVAREAFHMCVVAETYSAASLGEIHARANDPTVRAVLGSVLSDEVHHARLGWSLLATMFAEHDGDALRAHLQSEVPGAFDAFAKDLFGDPSAMGPSSLGPTDKAIAEAHGYLALRDDYAVFRGLVDDVWIPGLAGLGLDPRALLARYPSPVST